MARLAGAWGDDLLMKPPRHDRFLVLHVAFTNYPLPPLSFINLSFEI
jgi:hypothetical protein